MVSVNGYTELLQASKSEVRIPFDCWIFRSFLAFGGIHCHFPDNYKGIHLGAHITFAAIISTFGLESNLSSSAKDNASNSDNCFEQLNNGSDFQVTLG
jgi:hypothetical protein